MRVRFWGTRGSIAKPGPSTLRYGGNTSCIEVTSDDGTLVVLDCGTGCHELARAALTGSASARRGHLLVSHMHWDHIQGFPFFDPLFTNGNEWDVYAPGGHARQLRSALAGQMSYEFHPVTLDAADGTLRFHELTEGVFQAGPIRITCQYLNHPALTLGYRIEADDSVLVYASDHEPHARPSNGREPVAPTHLEDLRHVRFLAGADLVIHDAQYALDDFPARSGWGHSPAESVVDYAAAAEVRQVALHHHDPLRDDDGVDRLAEIAQERAARARHTPEVFAAREGAVIDLARRPERAASAATEVRSALLPQETAPVLGVLLVGMRSESLRGIETALAAEPLRMCHYTNPEAALRHAREERPALFIVDQADASERDLDFCRAVREDPAFAEVPVLLLTDSRRGADAMGSAFRAGVSDYLAQPIKPTLLRARVRSWLLRAGPA